MQTQVKQVKPQSLQNAQTLRYLSIKRLFTKPGVHPFDEIEWELRTTTIQNEKGQVIFEQRNVEVPKDWSQTATNIVASKYFHGKLGTAEHESSLKQLISRVADTIAQWGVEGGYFRSEEDAQSVPRRVAPPAGSPEGFVQFSGLV